MYQNEKWLKAVSIILILYGVSNGFAFLGACLLFGIPGAYILTTAAGVPLTIVSLLIALLSCVFDLLAGLFIPPFKISDLTGPVLHMLFAAGCLKFGLNVFTDQRIRDLKWEEKENQ